MRLHVTPILGAMMLGTLTLFSGCEIPATSTEKNDLASMSTTPIEIVGRTTYTAYIARDWTEKQLGLMNVTEDELAENQGMIFVFDTDRLQNFWMRNTIIPLDIAYIRSDGTIVKTYTMEPLNENGYPSIEAACFVLEVNGGQFEKWGITEGDHVNIPEELLEE